MTISSSKSFCLLFVGSFAVGEELSEGETTAALESVIGEASTSPPTTSPDRIFVALKVAVDFSELLLSVKSGACGEEALLFPKVGEADG